MLCGCSSKENITPIVKDISFKAVVHYYNEIYECAVQVSGEGDAQINIIEPKELAGMKFTCKDDKIVAEYLGLKYEPQLDSIPSGAVLKALYSIINDANKENAKAEQSEGNYEICGKIGDYSYTLMLSPAGLPIKAKIPDDRYTIEFKDVTIVSQ